MPNDVFIRLEGGLSSVTISESSGGQKCRRPVVPNGGTSKKMVFRMEMMLGGESKPEKLWSSTALDLNRVENTKYFP